MSLGTPSYSHFVSSCPQGYSASECIGRNCRFLQGDATSPSSVANIRRSIANEEGFTQLLLNYRADGTPFWNLLCCIPLRDATGTLTYFIGGQTNVTSAISSNDKLAFLLIADTVVPEGGLPTGLSEDVKARARVCEGAPLKDLQLDMDNTGTAMLQTPLVVTPPPPLPSPSGRKRRVMSQFFGGAKDKLAPPRSPVPTMHSPTTAPQTMFATPAPLQVPRLPARSDQMTNCSRRRRHRLASSRRHIRSSSSSGGQVRFLPCDSPAPNPDEMAYLNRPRAALSYADLLLGQGRQGRLVSLVIVVLDCASQQRPV